jgi:hypothetical protein
MLLFMSMLRLRCCTHRGLASASAAWLLAAVAAGGGAGLQTVRPACTFAWALLLLMVLLLLRCPAEIAACCHLIAGGSATEGRPLSPVLLQAAACAVRCSSSFAGC